MCGICGIVFKAGRSTGCDGGQLIRKMSAAMTHRGPDDTGFHADGEQGVFLGHNRLSIIDLSSAGQQPFVNETGSLFALVNGEIYNFAELRSSLIERGHEFKSKTDAEVILHLFEEDGNDAWQHLRGMYACAVYDADTGRICLARDPCGMKPLYVYEDTLMIAFASEIHALKTIVPDIEYDIEGIMDFLLLGCICAPNTHMKNVKALLPGQTALIANGKIRFSSPTTQADWCLAALESGRADPGQLRECIRDSVKRHLISDAPIGLFLSGGIDSGTIAGVTAQARGSEIRAVNVTVPGHRLDESGYARQTASHYGIGLTEIPLDQSAFENDIDTFFKHLDLPSIDGFNTYAVSKAAREAGLTVALSGLGGDELFAGYSTFSWIPRLTAANRIAGMAGASGRRAVSALLAMSNRKSGAKRVAQLIGTGPADRRIGYLSFRGLFVGGILENLIRPDLRHYAVEALERFMENTKWSTDKRFPDHLWVAGMEIQNYMCPVLLRDTDALSMAHSLEVRVPFVDVEVIRHALPFLAGRFDGDGYPKWPLRQALDRPLPHGVVARKKQGFSFPWQNWMAGIASKHYDELLDSDGEWRNILKPDSLRRWKSDYLAGKAHWRCFWALYVLLRMI